MVYPMQEVSLCNSCNVEFSVDQRCDNESCIDTEPNTFDPKRAIASVLKHKLLF